jgi:CMP/dCMP kinase
VVTALAARDELDRTRATSPLKVAPDAIRIDTTGKPVSQVVEEVLKEVKKKMANG